MLREGGASSKPQMSMVTGSSAFADDDNHGSMSIAVGITHTSRSTQSTLAPYWQRGCDAGLQTELVAEVEAADRGVVHDIVGSALHQHLARIDDVGAVGEAQRLAHIMVGDQHADAAVGEVAHQLLDVADRDRVDTGERL